MARRASSLSDTKDVSITRDIDSAYDNVKIVAINIDAVIAASNGLGAITIVNTNIDNIILVGNSIDDINAISPYALDIQTVAASIVNVDLVGGNISDVTAVAGSLSDIGLLSDHIDGTLSTDITDIAGSIANINTVAGISADITAVSTNTANINIVSGSIANVNTVGGSIVNVNAVAADLTNIDLVAADSIDIGVVATNIADVNTAATNIVAIQGASANAIAAASSATDAQTAQTAAELAETNAAADLALTNADVVLTHADVVLTGLDVITTGNNVTATNADVVTTTQDAIDTAADAAQTALDRIATGNDKTATNADVVLTAADVVSTGLDAASTAADVISVASIFDNFDDRYLGSKAADPTLDNDGDPLLAGAVYWNNVSGEVRFYNGAVWEAPSAQAATSATAALASEQAAAADAILTAADVVTTNQDTLDTAADLVATNQDTIDTAADLVQTNLDQIATAADRVQTGLDVTSSSASASTATTQASNAATSASNASTSEGNASTSETNAGTSETNALASENLAADWAEKGDFDVNGIGTRSAKHHAGLADASAIAAAADLVQTNLDTVATAADVVLTNADVVLTGLDVVSTAADVVLTGLDVVASEAAKTAAETALDSFDDRYLGAKVSDPTLDNDGAALITGALYFNTTTNVMKVYDGAAWLAAYADASGSLLATNNLSDLASASAARTNLVLGNVDNTADSAKPVSTAQQTALDLKLTITAIDDIPVDAATTVPISSNWAFDHDVADDHIDWTLTNAKNIHTDNYTDTVYTHPSDGSDLGLALTNAFVISDVNVNTAGHVTGFATRELTPANVGADPIGTDNSDNNAVNTSSATAAQGVLAGTALQSETSHADVLVDADIGVNVQAHSAILDATTASFLTADETKLDGIEALATADQTDAEIRTAVEAATDSNVFTDADHTKLNAVAASANNYTHPSDGVDPGVALAGATIFSDFEVNTAGHVTGSTTRELTPTDIGLGSVDNTTDANKPVSTAQQTALDLKVNNSEKGAINGVATLDGSGLVPSGQLPSYVDDVLEYANFAALPGTGVAGVIYVTIDDNATYRWTGSVYVSLSNPLDYASQAEAEAGTENTKVMTSLRVDQAIVDYAYETVANVALKLTITDIDDVPVDAATTVPISSNWAFDIAALVALNTAKLTANTVNVTAAGALMDSEVTNLADVKAFATTDYATAAQGTLAASALQSELNDLTGTVTWANIPIANVPTGTTSVTVSLGDHNHSGIYEPVLTTAGQVEMETGTEVALRSMSPLRVAQAIAALAASGGNLSLGTPTGISIPLNIDIGTDVTLPAANTTEAGLLTAALWNKLDGVEGSATADQTDSQIETAYNAQVAVMSQATAEAGTSTTVERVTAQRIKQAIDALSPGTTTYVQTTEPVGWGVGDLWIQTI
jgi:hypothetical protein